MFDNPDQYQADLHGAGKFPLKTIYPSVGAATAAVCNALNLDLFRGGRLEPDGHRAQLLHAFSDLVDGRELYEADEADWRVRLCDAALLPEGVSGFDDGNLFVMCSDDAIRCVWRDECAPCVKVTPYDRKVSERMYYVLEVSPEPDGPLPCWLTETIVEMETCELAPVRGASTYAFETYDAAQCARTYFRVRSAIVSNVYTIDKPS
jgi:hypothetical protein